MAARKLEVRPRFQCSHGDFLFSLAFSLPPPWVPEGGFFFLCANSLLKKKPPTPRVRFSELLEGNKRYQEMSWSSVLKLNMFTCKLMLVFLLFQVSHSWSRIKSRGGPPALFGHSAIKVKLACVCLVQIIAGILSSPLTYEQIRDRRITF